MATKILGNNAYSVITTFNSCSYFYTTGTFSKSDDIISININSASSDGTNMWRGFYFSVGSGRRMKYSFDYKYIPVSGTSSSTIGQVAWEQATPISLTMTTDWQTATGIFVRSQQQGTTALVFYTRSTTFPLGTYYFRNISLERMPWIFTVNGKPLTVTV